jgi:adenylylsulfate kinase-like enzyme
MSTETARHVAALRPIDWLDWQTCFLFFTGKGGVGKTTVAVLSELRGRLAVVIVCEVC